MNPESLQITPDELRKLVQIVNDVVLDRVGSRKTYSNHSQEERQVAFQRLMAAGIKPETHCRCSRCAAVLEKRNPTERVYQKCSECGAGLMLAPLFEI